MIFTVEFPLPHKDLSPNGRPNRYAKARVTKNARLSAKLRALAALNGSKPPRWERAEVQAVFYFASNRRRDHDNLIASAKALFDGIADAGIVENDTGFRHAEPETRIDKDRPRLEITISPLDR